MYIKVSFGIVLRFGGSSFENLSTVPFATYDFWLNSDWLKSLANSKEKKLNKSKKIAVNNNDTGLDDF